MAYINTNNNVLIAASLFILFSAPSSANGQPTTPPDSVGLNVRGALCCTPDLSCPGPRLVGEAVSLNCASAREVQLEMITDAAGIFGVGLSPGFLPRSTKVPCDLRVRYPFRSTTSCQLPNIPADVPAGYFRAYPQTVGGPVSAENGVVMLNTVPGRFTFVKS